VPIYEYVCSSCQQQFEVRQKVSDPPVSTCGRCGGTVTKLISSPAIMFKGSGWYVTDYSDKLKPPASGEPGEKGGTAGDGKKEAPPSTGSTGTPASPATGSSGSSSPTSSSSSSSSSSGSSSS
jgi:putative FmdB family regulatory protein